MSEITVKQLAFTVGISINRLLAQLSEAGISATDADATLTEQEKFKLLGYLRRSHGKDEDESGAAHSQVTLKRKPVSELQQPPVAPRSTAEVLPKPSTRGGMIVSVEVRRKRTYVKRGEDTAPPTLSPVTTRHAPVERPRPPTARDRNVLNSSIYENARHYTELLAMRAERETSFLASHEKAFKDKHLTIYSVRKSVPVYIPVRQYELTLKHRLLDQLGAFSNLLLDALSRLPEQGVAWVQSLTGLSREQLRPILSRLEGLDLLHGATLSPRGQQLANWKCHLHDQSRRIWLDGNYQKHDFCGDETLALAEYQEEELFLLRLWDKRDGSQTRLWPSKDWNEDCERQRNRLMSQAEQYLPIVYEGFPRCFPGADNFRASEWELGVRYVPEAGSNLAIEVELAADQLRFAADGNFVFANPVMLLTTRYRLPQGAPDRLRAQQPDDLCQIVGVGLPPQAPERLLTTPPGHGSWPELEEADRTQIVEILYSKITHATDPAEALFDREHGLEERWQAVCFDWTTVLASLQGQGLHRFKVTE